MSARSEQTELRLLRAATGLFAERGFHGTSIRDIAEAAGLAVSAVYYYAASKEKLLEHVMVCALDRLEQASREALAQVTGPSERLSTLIMLHVALHARNPRTAQVADQEVRALGEDAWAPIVARRDAYEEIWRAVLVEGVAAREFQELGSVGRLALLQMCTGVAHWYRPTGDLSTFDLCAQFADMGLALAGATRDGRPSVVSALTLPDPVWLLGLAEIASEPRATPHTSRPPSATASLEPAPGK